MRKIIEILLATILVLVLVPTAVIADSGKKPITPAQLKDITFVHYAKPNKPGKPPKPEPPHVDNSAYLLLGLQLPDTMTYYINPSGGPEGAFSEIEMAFEAWDQVTGSELFSAAQTTNDVGLVADGQNTVSWTRIVPKSTIALTRIWYLDDGNPETLNRIVETDMVFNSMLKWGIDPDDEGPAKLKRAFDVQNIATHEVGHVLGLGDLYEDQYRELTMYGYGSTGETQKISLESGDIAGAQVLY